MLVLTRKPRQNILLYPSPQLPPETTVGELFEAGPIAVVVARVEDGKVRMGVEADRRFVIMRGELEGWERGR